ncbi:hypothetical protein [Desulfurococcus mucosus]|uniref:Uncharacterized protein n=1 Tax=Desulfurococcus mucosus (strain ATCC 35584 / DSM 2162 / JCM 9187 / O7/1) TaxID=765177 RepID=E8R8N3_DESM0|nr:hypothetical protein [Desulfurococcus mucosus]ADV64859.1 hypothetical protein Desmu_0549 [Desulfurococcus mucosus DSM 2162]
MTHHFVGLPAEGFAEEAVGIVEKARERGVVLRIMGALGIYIHCRDKPESLRLYDALGRFKDKGLVFTDLDLAAYGKQRGAVMDLFEKELGFKYDPYVKALFAGKRLIYHHPGGLYHVDVFFDKLEFSHDVYLGDKPGKGVLELDYPTLPLAYLVLEKLQIHRINWKDLVDLAVIFHAHRLCGEGGGKADCIDEEAVATPLADDWGFWYDAVVNIGKVKDILAEAVKQGKIQEADATLITGRLDRLLATIEAKPKTKNWVKRSKVGTSKPWYREVEELER